MIDLEKEIQKIDIDKLKKVHLRDTLGTAHDWEVICFYLAKPGRLNEKNTLMAMPHVGGGVFMSYDELEDGCYDDTNILIRI